MDVVMGLLAALCWGATDFLVGVNARNVGVQRAVFFGQLIGLILMSAILFGSSAYQKLFMASSHALMIGVVASFFTLGGSLAISKAFALGKTAVVAPLVTLYGVVTALFSWIGGDNISPTQLLGMIVCVTGVVFASIKERALDTRATQSNGASIFFALLAALLYGSSFWLQGKFALPYIGAAAMLWLGYAVGIIAMLPTFLISVAKATLKLPPNAALLPLCAASLFNLGGFSAFAWGALNGSIAVVTVISTLSGGIAAIMGYFFYKERLAVLQLAGILLVLAGAAVLHANS